MNLLYTVAPQFLTQIQCFREAETISREADDEQQDFEYPQIRSPSEKREQSRCIEGFLLLK